MRKLKIIGNSLLVTLSLGAFAKPVDAFLKLQERISIAQLAQNVSDPSSPRYGKFYTPAEIRELTAPTDNEYAKLIQSLKQEGFQVIGESKTHLWITIRGDDKLFSSVFGTQLSFKKSLLRNEEFSEVLVEPVAPTRLNIIESVGGLDTRRKAVHHHMLMDPLGRRTTTKGLSPASIKTAYGFDPIYQSGVNGAGQHIAIATYDGFNIADVNQYYKLLSLSPAPAVDQVAFNGTAAYDENSAVETQLDAEFSGMIAPGAKVHVFTSAANNDLGELQMFTAILDDNRAKVVNYSWGSCETALTPAHRAEMEPVFNRAVAQGVNIVVASGDSGSDGCGDGTNKADWPASHPSVVAVGGTTATISGSTLSESGWSGSGGGVSDLFALPIWQEIGLASPFVKRSFPDVAFNADPKSGQAVYAHISGVAQFKVIGGTSMAAPQWSGFLALVGQARANAKKGTLGFLNPVIYGLSASDKAKAFNDVKTGKNGIYSATTGWDAVTGLGSLRASTLESLLVSN